MSASSRAAPSRSHPEPGTCTCLLSCCPATAPWGQGTAPRDSTQGQRPGTACCHPKPPRSQGTAPVKTDKDLNGINFLKSYAKKLYHHWTFSKSLLQPTQPSVSAFSPHLLLKLCFGQDRCMKPIAPTGTKCIICLIKKN